MIILVKETGSGRYSAWVEGRLLVKSARTPLCDAARVLLAEGIDPETELELKREGRSSVDMRGKLSWFAARTVQDDGGGTPSWRKFADPGARPTA